MIHRKAADHAPRYFALLQRLDEQGDIAATSRGLPVIELALRHRRWLSFSKPGAVRCSALGD